MEKEKTHLPEKNKKKFLIAGGVIILLLIIVVALEFSGSQTPAPSIPQPTSIVSTQNLPAVQYQVDINAVPAPLAEDFVSAVTTVEQNGEYKFLTDKQKKEFEGSSMVVNGAIPSIAQTYTLALSDSSIESRVPALPQSVPVYLIARPSDRSIFSVIKDIAQVLGVKGSVIRTDSRTYAVGNLQAGTFPLTFDLYNMNLTVSNLNLPGADATAVKDTLTKAGLLNFPNNVSRQTDQTGGVWYRITPQLALPVIAMDQPTSTFLPGSTGSIDAAVDKNNNITGIKAMFPNVVEKGTVALAPKDEIVKRLTSGSFLKGDITLQYPGATTLTDKRNFFTLQQDSNISITAAQIDSITCGYFLSNGQTITAILPPVCQAAGRGSSGGFPIIFRVIVSAVE